MELFDQPGTELVLHVTRGPMREHDTRPASRVGELPTPGTIRTAMDGPTSEGLRMFASRSNSQMSFRVMPSVSVAGKDGTKKLAPMTKRPATVNLAVSGVELLFVADSEQRYYRITGIIIGNNFEYEKLLPPGHVPARFKRQIRMGTPVVINYDGHDTNGELFTTYSEPVLPFPMNIQRIHDTKDGDYSIIRPVTLGDPAT